MSWGIIDVSYVCAGAWVFKYIENWDFAPASEFCLMTLLTIGYGNIVPVSSAGRVCMILYSIFGLCLSGFFIISMEDVILQDALESSVLRSRDSLTPQTIGSTETGLDNTTENLDPVITNQSEDDPLPSLPLTQYLTNTSVVSNYSEYPRDNQGPIIPTWIRIYRTTKSIVWILAWWLGGAAIFAYFEEWSYMDGVYFSFVSMTGIGYGDFTIHTPTGIEFWWLFLFNAVHHT
jgi:potassium channel subfamily K